MERQKQRLNLTNKILYHVDDDDSFNKIIIILAKILFKRTNYSETPLQLMALKGSQNILVSKLQYGSLTRL